MNIFNTAREIIAPDAGVDIFRQPRVVSYTPRHRANVPVDESPLGVAGRHCAGGAL